MSSTLFQFIRINEFPIIFQSLKTPVTVDIIEVIIFFVFTLIAVTYMLIIPGYSKKRCLYIIVKVAASVLIGCSLMVGNFGQEWEIGEIESVSTPYRAGEKNEITAQIAIKIGLRSVNITLKRQQESDDSLKGEIINYNERFEWTWDQGRFGFGPNAGRLHVSFREAQRRGLPLPIIWIVDYFIIDGEGVRFGRFYRTAGWYSHILLWAALPAWILANIFLQSVGRYAAYFTGLIGILELSSCIIWISVRNPTPLVIPLGDKVLKTSYGSTFWLTCSAGIFCLIIAIILIVLDLRHPNSLSKFLGVDLLDQYDECVIRAKDLNSMRHVRKNEEDSIELGKMNECDVNDDSGVVLLKRRSTVKIAQKNRIRVSSVPIKLYSYEDPHYENHPSTSLPIATDTLRKLPLIPPKRKNT